MVQEHHQAFVLRLAENVPKHKNYKFFYHNWFSSLALSAELNKDGIQCLSTVRKNRLKGCVLKDETDLKKEGRGSIDYKIETHSNTIAIAWYHDEPLHLLSNYSGIEPLDTCRRWEAKSGQYIDIPRPFAVK